MKYQIFFSGSAEKNLRKLPTKIVPKVREKIFNLADDPRPHGAIVLKDFKPETWRIRIGEWRVLYRIEDKVKIINISRILHRREVYRKK